MKCQEVLNKTLTSNRKIKRTQYFSTLFIAQTPPNLTSSTSPNNITYEKRENPMVSLVFSLETYRNQRFSNALQHTNRSKDKTAGELVNRSGSHPASHPEFSFLGLHFCLHSAAEVCQTKIGFRRRGAQSALSNRSLRAGTLSRSRGLTTPGSRPA